MDITRRCDYALRILRAAYQSGDRYVSVSEIAEHECIPYAFARSIQHDLAKGGLVKTVRGAHGGLSLSCDPAKVTLLEVLEVLQGPLSIATCASDPSTCEKSEKCSYNKMWCGANRILQLYFSSIALGELLEKGSEHPMVHQAMDLAKPESTSADLFGIFDN